METRIEAIDETRIDARAEACIKDAGAILRRGGLVVFPTETVYGLGADAFNSNAAERIYTAKGRPSDNPLIVHIADTGALDRLCVWLDEAVRARAMKLANAFWPGPLTMVLKKNSDLPARTTGGLDTVAVRLPANKIARKMIRAAGGFVAAPSANRSGKPSPTAARFCIEDMNGRADMIIDGGDCVIGLESTIVDLTGTEPVILRPGNITEREIRSVLGLSGREEEDAVQQLPDEAPPRAPGMKYRHYAPKGDFTVFRGIPERVTDRIVRAAAEARAAGKTTGIIASDETKAAYDADIVRSFGSGADHAAVAHNLYRILREMDEAGAEAIFGEMPGAGKLSAAIENRLFKACGGHVEDV